MSPRTVAHPWPISTLASRMVADTRKVETNLFILFLRHQGTQPQRAGTSGSVFCTVCFASQSCLGSWSLRRVLGTHPSPPCLRMVADTREVETNLFILFLRHQGAQPQRADTSGSVFAQCVSRRSPASVCGHFAVFGEEMRHPDPHPGLQDGRRHPRLANKSVHPDPETPEDPAAACGQLCGPFPRLPWPTEVVHWNWTFWLVLGGI